MEVTFGFDHVVIRVDDLAVATVDYTTLGFTVVRGGEHTDRASHNALIAFADGSYLELIAFNNGPSPRIAKSQNTCAPSNSWLHTIHLSNAASGPGRPQVKDWWTLRSSPGRSMTRSSERRVAGSPLRVHCPVADCDRMVSRSPGSSASRMPLTCRSFVPM